MTKQVSKSPILCLNKLPIQSETDSEIKKLSVPDSTTEISTPSNDTKSTKPSAQSNKTSSASHSSAKLEDSSLQPGDLSAKLGDLSAKLADSSIDLLEEDTEYPKPQKISKSSHEID